MKKCWFPILCGAWPYLCLGTFLLNNFVAFHQVIFFIACGIGCASVMVGFVSFAFGLKERDIAPPLLCKWALAIKLAHLPFYLFMFLDFLALPMGAVLFFCLDVMAMFCSAGFGLSSLLRCRKAGLIGNWECVVYFLMNLFFVTDVIAAILLRRKTKNI